ncbi:hypothetical protein H0H87_011089 [Tephrocybe sp. NHM501043]|nr:hypothetical protein H0H87_011089 [Tephrocybe sp. NHM501043]
MATIKHKILTREGPTTKSVDLSKTVIAKDYPTAFIKVIDNVFTARECAALIARAEASEDWKPAMIQTPLGDRVDKSIRDNDRILLFDDEAAREIFGRVWPHVQELDVIGARTRWEGVVERSGTWRLLGLNERLSFLRYGKKHYFKPHFDGQIELPDGRKSWVTFQIYLNDSSDGLHGGATRIFGKRKGHVDIEPKMGRVLIFEQGPFWHSGEEVSRGMKYTMRTDFLFEKVV